MARNFKALSSARIGNMITDARNKQALAERLADAANKRSVDHEKEIDVLKSTVRMLKGKIVALTGETVTQDGE